MPEPMNPAIPPASHALPVLTVLAISDMCQLVVENPGLAGGRHRAGAERLCIRLRSWSESDSAPFLLSNDDTSLLVDMCEALARAAISGERLGTSALTMRLVERVIVPLTDAAGYPGDARG